MLSIKQAKAQVWKDNTGTPSTISTNTDDDVGVGTSTPDGKVEVNYCDQNKNGIVITKKDCSSGTSGTGNSSGQGDGFVGPGDPNPPLLFSENWTNMPFIYSNSLPLSTTSSVLYNNHFSSIAGGIGVAPLFWAKTLSNPALSFPLGVSKYTTRFVVMPNGLTGINTSTPRASLDVFGEAASAPVAIFGTSSLSSPAITSMPPPPGVTARYTQHLAIVPRSKALGFNKITQSGDVGMYFTDGKGNDGTNANGSNLEAGLVIAPWTNNAAISGGIRIAANGDVNVCGDLRTTKVTVNAKWWPDFVFANNYNLMPLDSLSAFIQENKHLPGFSADTAIINNGLDLGETQSLQQQKIEELTLYIIEQGAKLLWQSQQLAEQAKKQAELEAKLNTILTK